MNISLISLVIVLVINTGLALSVWLQSPNRPLNRVFGLLVLGLIVWSATGYYDQTANISDPLFKILAGVPFAAAAWTIHMIAAFSLYFPETQPNSRRTRTLVNISAIISSIVATILVLFFGEYVISAVTTSASQGNNVIPGPLYLIFPMIYIFWLMYALINLSRKFKRSSLQVERTQLTYVFLGFLLTIGIALFTNVALPILAHNPSISRFGYIFTLFLVGSFSYAIVAHRLFDIRRLVARSVAYVLLVAVLTGFYALAIFGLVSLLVPHTQLSPLQMAVFTLGAILLAFSLPPLRRFFERATDRVFFRDHYDAQALLDRVSSIFATELELNPLMNKFLRELTKTMRLVNAQLVVMEGKSVYGQTAHGKLVVAPLGPDSLPVFKHPLMVADLMPAAHAKHVMVAQGIQVVTQLRAHGELVGYLALGDKQAGTVYSNEDLAVLEIMRKELSVAVANAKAYDEISQFNVTLQQRIRDATKRLKIANTNLRALDKTKDEFISMASHQLGTPLTAITGYLSMTLDSDKNNLTADQKEFVSYALEAAEKMVYMSGDMLNVSRLNSGRFMIQRQPAELVKMVQQEIHQLEPAAARKGLKLTTDLPDTPVTLSIDESKTRQVIMNFIDNALYYTETGGVHVKLEQTKTHVILTVSDTGMGVPMAEQSKLFAKFYRAANAKSVRPDGTGLGLYLAKRVIEDQGGQLIFSSIEGKGSTFGFKLSKQDT